MGADKQNAVEKAAPKEPKDKQLYRDLVAFWILGLCNNFGYVVMLSAAHDILHRFEDTTHLDQEPKSDALERSCNIVSTGAILLADVIPGFVIKLIMPFLPFWINVRVLAAVGFSVAGFLCVGFAEDQVVALLGVVFTSAACGVGESSILAYTSNYNRNSLSTWSSGTGGAGVIGALTYAGLCAIPVSSRNIMLIMLIIPALECIAFWIILRKPSDLADDNDKSGFSVDESKPLEGGKEKVMFITSLFKYMMPLLIVYFCEYFINQGLFELVNFENIFLNQKAQYRWLCVDYQIGVFISRSSVNLIKVKYIWILSLLQFVNVVYFLTEVIFFYTPSIWIAFVIVFWEGLLGGGAYVNTFYKISQEVPRSKQKFAIGVTVQADSFGIMLSGFLALPVHNAICRLPAHTTLFS